MKAKDKNSKPDAGKQKKQLLVLGGLVVVLGGVVAVQFGGSEPEYEVAALAQEAPAPAATGDAGSSAPLASAAPASAPVSGVADNPVLSQPVEEASLPRSPFSNFWNSASTDTAVANGPLPEIAPPQVTLNATLPSETRPLAVIDGELHFVGDSIQGWELAEIEARRVLLRSPSQALVAVEMPLLSATRPLPAGRDG